MHMYSVNLNVSTDTENQWHKYRKDEAFIVVGMITTGLKFNLMSFLIFPFTKEKIGKDGQTS